MFKFSDAWGMGQGLDNFTGYFLILVCFVISLFLSWLTADIALLYFHLALRELVFPLSHERDWDRDFIPFGIVCGTGTRICRLKIPTMRPAGFSLFKSI